MDDDLARNYRRWLAADAAPQDENVDAGDAACRAVFAELPADAPVPVDFAARTMEAIAAAAARDARRARRTRRLTLAGAGLGVGAGVYFGGAWAVAALSTVLIGILNLFINATVSVATGVQSGADVWSVLASLGRAAAAFVAQPGVTMTMLILQGVALGALVALQRLLGSERESFK